MVGPISLEDPETQQASERVLDAVADAEGTSPMEFDRQLYEVIGPDALDTVVESGAPDLQVELTYLGYEITVRGNGEITLDHPDG